MASKSGGVGGGGGTRGPSSGFAPEELSARAREDGLSGAGSRRNGNVPFPKETAKRDSERKVVTKILNTEVNAKTALSAQNIDHKKTTMMLVERRGA